MKTYIFDVNGTLVSSGEPIDSTFMRWFELFGKYYQNLWD